jgi:hypothetical protein
MKGMCGERERDRAGEAFVSSNRRGRMKACSEGLQSRVRPPMFELDKTSTTFTPLQIVEQRRWIISYQLVICYKMGIMIAFCFLVCEATCSNCPGESYDYLCRLRCPLLIIRTA